MPVRHLQDIPVKIDPIDRNRSIVSILERLTAHDVDLISVESLACVTQRTCLLISVSAADPRDLDDLLVDRQFCQFLLT